MCTSCEISVSFICLGLLGKCVVLGDFCMHIKCLLIAQMDQNKHLLIHMEIHTEPTLKSTGVHLFGTYL